MTETLVAVSPPSPKKNQDPIEPGGSPPTEAFGPIPQAGPERELTPAELAVIKQMVLQAKDAGVALTGPDGLLKALTKTVIETALDEELSEHLGYDKHAVMGVNTKVCRFGRTTGTGSGCTKVKYVSACYSVYCGLATTTAWTRSEVGDSGGPWYYGNNAYGIHSGSGTRDGVRVNYFTNSRKALQKMALTAMTKR